MPWRRLVFDDQRLERGGARSVVEPQLVGRAALVQQRLQRARIEGEESRAIAPPVLDVLPRDHAPPLADLAQLPYDLALVALDDLRQDAREKAPALHRAALEQRALVVVEVGDARREQLAQRAGRVRSREGALQPPGARLARDLAVERPAAPVVPEHALLLETGEVVLEEERRAVGDVLKPLGEA